MEVRIFGGIGEIGGNKVLVSSPERLSIMLDFGKSFSREEAFFQYPFMSPMFPEDYFKTGLLPPSEGPEWKMEGFDIAGLFISHAHLDHWGYLPLIHREIPIYLGEASKAILEAYRSMGFRDLSALDDFKISTFRTGDSLDLEGLKVIPIHVDHSVPGAYGFLVECCSRKVAYTGDLRMHGPRSDMTRDFLDRLAEEEVDLLLMEATKVAPENDPEASLVKVLENRIWYRWRREPPKRVNFEVSSEREVGERMREVLSGSSRLILVEVSPTDVDRVRTVCEVARRMGRELVLDERVGFMAEALSSVGIQDLPQPGDYLLWRRKRRKGSAEVKLGSREPRSLVEYVGRVEDRRGADSVIWGHLRRELLKDEGSYFVVTNNATRFLYEIPLGVKPRIDFVMSRSEPFSEESALSLDRLMNWLLIYDVHRYYRIHVSGHLSPMQIGDVLKLVNPVKVAPIHTEHPDLFDLYVPQGMKDRVLLPEVGGPIDV